jgi:tRNA(adenine34) deaminase
MGAWKVPLIATAQERLMAQALRLAHKASGLGEVPVGALLVQGPWDVLKPKILARAHNVTESRFDPSGHAEMQVLRRGAKRLGRWRLNDCHLIVTLEPCAMCAGAAVWGRLASIIYGAADPKAGACGSVLQVAHHPQLNHRIAIQGGVMEEVCAQVLRDFFKKRRGRKGV